MQLDLLPLLENPLLSSSYHTTRSIEMKRIRFGGGEGEMESVTMANVLMLLSRGSNNVLGAAEESDSSGDSKQTTSAPGRVFECKTCNRRFPSFQALGGHRASHKKPRTGGGDGAAAGAALRPRVHECSFCGLEFAIGQALGGHMRRHRATAPRVDVLGRQRLGMEEEEEAKKSGAGDSDDRRQGLSLDLNLPPLEEDVELRRIGLSLEIVDHKIPCGVDCLR